MPLGYIRESELSDVINHLFIHFLLIKTKLFQRKSWEQRLVTLTDGGGEAGPGGEADHQPEGEGGAGEQQAGAGHHAPVQHSSLGLDIGLSTILTSWCLMRMRCSSRAALYLNPFLMIFSALECYLRRTNCILFFVEKVFARHINRTSPT